jgi:hypothetical protein
MPGGEKCRYPVPQGKTPETGLLVCSSQNVFADMMDSCVHTISGMISYCDRYSEGMKRVLKTFGPIPEFSRATVEKVNQVGRLPA